MEEAFAVLPNRNFHNQYEDGFPGADPERRWWPRLHRAIHARAPDLDAVMSAKAQAAGIPRLYNQAALDMLQPATCW